MRLDFSRRIGFSVFPYLNIWIDKWGGCIDLGWGFYGVTLDWDREEEDV